MTLTVTFNLRYSEAVYKNGSWQIEVDNFPFTIEGVIALPENSEGELVIEVSPALNVGRCCFYITPEYMMVLASDRWLYGYKKGILHKALETKDDKRSAA